MCENESRKNEIANLMREYSSDGEINRHNDIVNELNTCLMNDGSDIDTVITLLAEKGERQSTKKRYFADA